MQWLNDGFVSEDTKVADCEIQSSYDTSQKFVLKNVYAWKNLNLPCQNINANELISSYPQLKEIPIRNFTNAKPRLLIGLNNARLGFSKNWIDCPPSGPIAVETALGWLLYGPAISRKSESGGHVLLVNSSFEDSLQKKYYELNDIVKTYYDLENFGFKTTVLQPTELVRANDIF